MKEYKLNIKVGDLVEVGRFRNVQTKIKSITIDEHGQPVIHTSKGKKKLFSCRLVKLQPGSFSQMWDRRYTLSTRKYIWNYNAVQKNSIHLFANIKQKTGH